MVILVLYNGTVCRECGTGVLPYPFDHLTQEHQIKERLSLSACLLSLGIKSIWRNQVTGCSLMLKTDILPKSQDFISNIY